MRGGVVRNLKVQPSVPLPGQAGWLWRSRPSLRTTETSGEAKPSSARWMGVAEASSQEPLRKEREGGCGLEARGWEGWAQGREAEGWVTDGGREEVLLLTLGTR